MRKISKVLFALLVLLLLFGAWAVYYAQDKGFSRHWRNFVHSEFRKRGVHATIRRLNLDPLRGLIAKDVLVYEDPAHEVLLMEVDKIAIDVDYSELFSGQVSIRSIEVRDAKISIPLAPERHSGELLRIDHFNGRILTPPDQLRIVRADAFLSGIHLSVHGSLSRADNPDEDVSPDNEELDPAQFQLSQLRSRRDQIRNFLSLVDQFDIDPESPPSLDVALRGELDRLSDVQVSGTLESGPLGYKGYRCETLSAAFEYSDRSLAVDSLVLEDKHGKLRSEFQFLGMDRDLQFSLSADNDLHGLMTTLFDAPRLNEFVFFHPPKVELSGVYHLEKPFQWDDLPLQVIGEIRSEGLTSRGVVFGAMGFDFNIDGKKLFLRNGRLEHKSGVLSGSLMRDAKGVQYEADIRLPPTVFSPFLELEGAKQFLKRWRFTEDSAVLATMSGSGPPNDSSAWITTGAVDLRNCELNDHPISELQCEFRLQGSDHEFFDVVLRRPEGEIHGKYIHLDHEKRLCHLNSVAGRVFPAHAVGWFAPKTAQHLVVYEFQNPPNLEIEGVIDTRPESPEKRQASNHDYSLSFDSEDEAYYELFDKRLHLKQPKGRVHIKGNQVLLKDFNAGLLGGTVKGNVALSPAESEVAYEVDAQLFNVNFNDLVALYDQPRETGGRLNAGAKITGVGPGLDNLKAEGRAVIREGDVFSIPSIGPLAIPISKVMPKIHSGFHNATEASLSFSIEDGIFNTNDFAASTIAYDLKGWGDIDLRSRALDLAVSINFRNMVLLASLMEFKGEGSLSEPVWRAKDLARIQGEPVRKITSTALDTIRKVGQTLPKPLGMIESSDPEKPEDEKTRKRRVLSPRTDSSKPPLLPLLQRRKGSEEAPPHTEDAPEAGQPAEVPQAD